MKQIDLKVKHFRTANYFDGGGPIKEAADELFPNGNNFEGVEMSRIGGKRYYHIMYSRTLFNQDKQIAFNIFKEHNDNEYIVRTLKLLKE